MTKRPVPGELVSYVPTGRFEEQAHIACNEVSSSANTRRAYWADFCAWAEFCSSRGVNPKTPLDSAVVAWVESMKRDGDAPKSRSRRISALCSVYRRLRKKGVVTHNPFSLEDGPDREKALPLEPTPIATPADVIRVLATCDDSVLGVRDAALLRVLWATGARRSSVAAMTFERLRKDRDAYIAQLVAKGQKEVKVLIRGKAADALTRWIALLRESKLSSGPLWRSRKGPLSDRALGHMVARRSRKAKLESPLSPHSFRVAFLTYNPAGIEAKQDAAGHADPATTRLYDRASWRGREAFEQMPEVEDTQE